MNFSHLEEREVSEIREFLNDLINGIENPWYKKEQKIQKERFFVTILWVVQSIREQDAKNVLVIGPDGPIDWCINKLGLLKNTNFSYTEFDLRYPFIFDDNHFDFIINTEVLEHIKDVDGSRRDIFNFSGVNSFLSECSRVLKSEKQMFLTTPNSCSIGAVCRVILHQGAISYKGHVREYSVVELDEVLNAAHFKTAYRTTIDTFRISIFEDESLHEDDPSFAAFVNSYRAVYNDVLNKKLFDDHEFRGDQIFCLAQNAK